MLPPTLDIGGGRQARITGGFNVRLALEIHPTKEFSGDDPPVSLHTDL